MNYNQTIFLPAGGWQGRKKKIYNFSIQITQLVIILFSNVTLYMYDETRNFIMWTRKQETVQ